MRNQPKDPAERVSQALYHCVLPPNISRSRWARPLPGRAYRISFLTLTVFSTYTNPNASAKLSEMCKHRSYIAVVANSLNIFDTRLMVLNIVTSDCKVKFMMYEKIPFWENRHIIDNLINITIIFNHVVLYVI